MKKAFRFSIRWLRYQLLKGGKDLRDIAEIVGISYETVRKIAIKSGINIEKDREAIWHAKRHRIPKLENKKWFLRQRGRGLIDLTRELGASESFVRHQIERLGLEPTEFYFRGPKRKIILVPCSYCGRILERKLWHYKKKEEGGGGYTHAFCNKKHQGAHMGEQNKKKAVNQPPILISFI